MKSILKLKTIDDIERELSIIVACEKKQKADISLSQIYDFLAESIELSIQRIGSTNKRNTINKLLGKYKFAKLISKGNYTKANQIPGFPPKDLGDADSALLRLKTSLTAFKLHSGPFAEHSVFGELDKKQWERIHGILAVFLFGYIQLFGDEKLRFAKDREQRKEKTFSEKKHNHPQKKKDDRDSKPNGHNNRKWKNKKKSHHKGNKNQGGTR
ncbi:DUF1569 domain-containing protein [Leptospira bourretii]|uniref:DUF1569 domain-containing protein n=1 Tax=Leptospira bourretii TaxID=2484962 RepID=A0A4R9IRS8_9LEPT|nr:MULTISPECIES: DUF1569 domain-containing protein [Leptospira]MCG6142347.1 DUF1569 domain-containing protein [Leptospira mtsangambouensis]TGK82817.1 DUF1569 domain-containing protein [Leptospira bourretii]TGK94162.1 DUF1569 domain-containing protein [Leptospira bourretii]TGL26194.1 DUF1569 domain-containing protein [Leptospira bourretii]TGL28066.1 DUF1569 domain-containing protein [Leptospira bourretii]